MISWANGARVHNVETVHLQPPELSPSTVKAVLSGIITGLSNEFDNTVLVDLGITWRANPARIMGLVAYHCRTRRNRTVKLASKS